MKFPRFILLALAAVVLMSGCGKSSSPTQVETDNTPTLDNTAPPTPEGLAVSEDPASGRSTMTWSPSSAADVSAYDVFVYSPDPSRDEAYTLLYTTDGPETRYSLDPTSEPTTKYFRVRAVDNTGNHSALSSVMAATIWPGQRTGGDPTAPPPPPRMDP